MINRWRVREGASLKNRGTVNFEFFVFLGLSTLESKRQHNTSVNTNS